MKTPLSTLAVKYVGPMPARNAMEAVRGMQADGSVTLRDAVAVTRSAGGQVDYYPIRPSAGAQFVAGMGLAGIVLGLLLGRRLRWSLLGGLLAMALDRLRASLALERIAAATPFVEKNESMLYLQVEDADWPAFWWTMQPHLEQGLLVMRTLSPYHAELAALLGPEPQLASTIAPASAADDFTIMRGIGPVIGARLHEGGVRTFAQLANMDAEQISQIAAVPERRVTSNDWIGQAKLLASSS